jgi:hypothetical protein
MDRISVARNGDLGNFSLSLADERVGRPCKKKFPA